MRDGAAQIRADRNAFFQQFPLVPPTISVGGGRSIYVSQKSVAAIQAIARVNRENSAEFRGALPLHLRSTTSIKGNLPKRWCAVR
jgi:hypothetical protein